MTIAELFIRLGFRVENRAEFDKAVTSLGFGETKALNLKYALAGVGAALVGLTYFGANAATNLYKFHMATGLSTEKLQKLQFAAARANVSASEVTAFIESIMSQQSEIALGAQPAPAWSLLGIDPRTNPLDMFDKIHERVKEIGGYPAMISRNLVGGLGGGDNITQWLRRMDAMQTGPMPQGFIQSTALQKEADALLGKFTQLKEDAESAGTIIGVKLGEPLLKIMEKLMAPGGPIDRFSDWLTRFSSATPEGERMRAKFEEIADVVWKAAAGLVAMEATLKTIATIGAASTVIKALFGLGGGAAAAASGGAAGAGGAAAAGAGGGAIGAFSLGSTLTVLGLIHGILLPLALVAYAGHKNMQKAEAEGKTIQEVLDERSPEDRKSSFLKRFLSGAGGGTSTSGEATGFFAWLKELLNAGSLKPIDFTGRSGLGGSGGVTITITQHINSTDPVAAGKESADRTSQVLSAFANQGAIGAIAH